MNNIVFGVVLLCVIATIHFVLPLVQQKVAYNVVVKAVRWAEQSYSHSSGADRKIYAETMLRQVLASLHIKITENQLDMLIEAAVFALNMEKKNSAISKKE